MGSLLAAGGLAWSAVAQVAEEFVFQMAIGRAVGVVSGRAPLVFIRRVPMPSEALYPLRTVFCALALYGRRPWPAAGASWPCSSPASSSVMPARRTSVRSSGSTRRWPTSRRSSPSWCLGSPSRSARWHEPMSGCLGSSSASSRAAWCQRPCDLCGCRPELCNPSRGRSACECAPNPPACIASESLRVHPQTV